MWRCRELISTWPWASSSRIPPPKCTKRTLSVSGQAASPSSSAFHKHRTLESETGPMMYFWKRPKPMALPEFESARQAGSLGCHFPSCPSLGPGEVVRCVPCWERLQGSYLCHYFSFRNHLESVYNLSLEMKWLGGWPPK